MKEIYDLQSQLLLQCLPLVAKETIFALKGGTGINFFYRPDFPRRSVDIDLTYLPLKDRDLSLAEIEQGLVNIKDRIQKEIGSVAFKEKRLKQPNILSKIVVIQGTVEIIIEPNLIMRGCVYPCQKLNSSKGVEKAYDAVVYDIPVLSFEDIYAGKICAALNRQHPRDLFDVGFMLNRGFDQKLKNAFLIYLICNNRPIHELLDPNLLDLKRAYTEEFLGMSHIVTSLETLIENRLKLIKMIKESLTEQDKAFLLSIKKGQADFTLFPVEKIEKLPAVQWKLYNIKRMDHEKHKIQLAKLESVLDHS